jgi:hypothetical protein
LPPQQQATPQVPPVLVQVVAEALKSKEAQSVS